MTVAKKSRKTQSALDKLTPQQALTVGEWCVSRLPEVEAVARALGRTAPELTGAIYEVAAARARRGRLAGLTPARAVRLALKREKDDRVVRRLRGQRRPEVACLDETIEAEIGGTNPADVLLDAETERERQDLHDDHDDRLSWVAVRAAAGHQPVALPRVARDSATRQARRFRVRARDLRDSGQGDFWGGWGEAA